MNTGDYTTLTAAMEAMRREGYTEDFNLLTDAVECRAKNCRMSPKEFKIDKYFRFEGPTDPGDQAILYAISSRKHKLKGLLVNGYGIYSEAASNDLVDKLSVDRK